MIEYVIFCVIFIVIYGGYIYLTATEPNFRRSDVVTIPLWLKRVLFPFLKKTEVSLLAVFGGIYMELSFLVISSLYFFNENAGSWNWRIVSGVWVCGFCVVSIIEMCVAGVMWWRRR